MNYQSIQSWKRCNDIYEGCRSCRSSQKAKNLCLLISISQWFVWWLFSHFLFSTDCHTTKAKKNNLFIDPLTSNLQSGHCWYTYTIRCEKKKVMWWFRLTDKTKPQSTVIFIIHFTDCHWCTLIRNFPGELFQYLHLIDIMHLLL